MKFECSNNSYIEYELSKDMKRDGYYLVASDRSVMPLPDDYHIEDYLYVISIHLRNKSLKCIRQLLADVVEQFRNCNIIIDSIDKKILM